jgi:glyoxylase-like metal-dependent hydrolase (beta-lactamase superfamily II)
MLKDMKLTKTLVVAALSLHSLTGCSATTHPVAPATLGVPTHASVMEALIDQPGPVTVTTVTSATWEVDRSGLIDLTDPKAKAAHLVDGAEPIELFIHAVTHPTQGTYLVDSGVERAFVTAPGSAVISGWMGSLAHLSKLTVQTDMATFLERQPQAPRGVWLTHMHLDHVLGLRDVPYDVPVFVGKGDAEESSFQNVFMRSVYDQTLMGKGPLHEVTAPADPDGVWDGLADVFGDGSVFAISVPGHTRGSTAFLARTPNGPVLLTGDACHTAWGWENGVSPGTFSEDLPKSKESLAKLVALVARHPSMHVRLGHQTRSRSGAKVPASASGKP